MIKTHYKHHPWKIIEEGWNPDNVEASESLFSIGNGNMGQRANFEEDYSGKSFQGSYLGGVYYPDKTRVGWWKNGYPEYFAKVLNAPNWIGVHISLDGEPLDLNTCTNIEEYTRVLDMEKGLYSRSCIATLPSGLKVALHSQRILCLFQAEMGVIRYEIEALNREAKIEISPYIDSGIKNQDSNWDDQFWETKNKKIEDNKAYIEAHTLKTGFEVGTFMQVDYYENDTPFSLPLAIEKTATKIAFKTQHTLSPKKKFVLHKRGGYVSSRTHTDESLSTTAFSVLENYKGEAFELLVKKQADAWKEIWNRADIQIEGDIKAQQAIRFNIFQLNQTYTGEDAGLNIGPKGFTGEKYGGSTYWDTEAYCIPFYMATKKQEVARNLLTYRYLQLDKAIENAAKLGFTNGAALYPMVTMNGEECHNEWEITFEEIHRNSAIAFAIFNYTRYTGDTTYIPEMGMEVLVGIARFWAQRVNYSERKKAYVMLGVTGPNEYENNVNNNWYTNYSAQWCMRYAAEQWEKLEKDASDRAASLRKKINLSPSELNQWKEICANMYFPKDETLGIYLQQDGFLDKEMTRVEALDPAERPINQHWSWDKILRSPYIKQADVLQGFYFFEDHFDLESLRKNYDFYEPFTVHESSLSPCIHAILAAKLGKEEQAYTFYLRTARLDLDDYNAEVHEGLHITSMAGTWMSIVEGFAGMRVKEDRLSFQPFLPKDWKGLQFRINFRGVIYSLHLSDGKFHCSVDTSSAIEIEVNGKVHRFEKQCALELTA